MILDFLFNLLSTIIGVALGAYILFFGRRSLWATLCIILLSVSGTLLAVLLFGAASGWDLIELQLWGAVAVVLLSGGAGVLLGHYRPTTAVQVIGFAAGASIALWLYDVAVYVVTGVALLPEQLAIGTGVVLIIIGGLLGLLLVRKDRDEALILITVIMGADIINDAIGLGESSSLTAIVLLSLVLTGLLVQYAAYLRELKAEDPLIAPDPAPSSVAYFQDLELDG